MIKPYNFRIDYGRLTGDARYRTISVKQPVISWAVLTDGKCGSFQSEYRIIVTDSKDTLWDSEWVQSKEQNAKYEGKPLPVGEKICFTVEVKDDMGNISRPVGDYFYYGQVDEWNAEWIASSKDEVRKAVRFSKNFCLKEKPEDAYLMVCGLGYHKVEINGKCADESLMDPAYADYSKTCYYVMMPELADKLQAGENKIDCTLGEGWRR